MEARAASLPLVGFRRELIDLAKELNYVFNHVAEVARWDVQPSDLEVCHFLDGLYDVVSRVESRASVVRCMCDDLRDRAIRHSMAAQRYVCPTCEGEGEIRFNASNDPQGEDYARCGDCGGTGELDGDGMDRVLRRVLGCDRGDRPGRSE